MEEATKIRFRLALAHLMLAVSANEALAVCPYDPACLNNPYGAGSPYKSDGINNPYSQYGSPYSNKSANNPYATDAPKIYDQQGNYRGRLSGNPYSNETLIVVPSVITHRNFSVTDSKLTSASRMTFDLNR